MKKIYISEQKIETIDGDKLVVVSVNYSVTHHTKWIAWIR